MIDTYTVKEIDYHTAKDFLLKHHYLSKIGNGFIAILIHGLYNSNNDIVGVICYNHISAPETLVGAFGLDRKTQQDKFIELTRLAMDDSLKERNLTSWFVARSIRLMRKNISPKALISYADSRFHVGYIYQATNFKYYGMTTKKKDFYVNGKIKQRGKTKGVEGGEWRDRPRKYRYAIVYDKSLNMKWKEEKYPKGENHEYKDDKPLTS